MSKRYDLAVVIGRFQPVHFGHLNLIDEAFKLADHVQVVIGSAGIARNIRNPFTVQERINMLLSCYGDKVAAGKLEFAGVRDQPYNDQLWVQSVQKVVDDNLISRSECRTVLIGHKKDHTTFYLDMFKPMFDYHEVEHTVPIDATTIRDVFFREQKWLAPVTHQMPCLVIDYLTKWATANNLVYDSLCAEAKFIHDYKAQWAVAPFQPVFTTTDAVVICSGHILLVKRRHEPGKGLWALPGGFLGNNEFIKDSMFRELKEETRIKVDDKTILASIKANRVFDAPGRSERGRTVTHAYLINLGWGPLPKVRGSDDAERAKWFPLNHFFNAMGAQMYEDHYDIATTLINS